jgi:hypothetical protein
VDKIRTVFRLTLDDAGDGAPAGELFGYFDGEICTLVGQLEGAEPAVLTQIRQEAMSARMIAILQAIEQHTAALQDGPGRQEGDEFLNRYRRHVAEEHGRLEPPDFERRRRVAIGELYVPPVITELVDGAVAPPERPKREISLPALAGEIDRTVLLGSPGGGKTSAANALMHRAVTSGAATIPFLITSRDFAAEDPPRWSMLAYVEHRLETFYQCAAPAGLVAKLLLTGRALMIFDGPGELLDPARRADVAARIERFCSEHPLARVLVTSRVVGYDQARLDDRQFTRYRLGDFTEPQVAAYARNWFAQEEGVDRQQAGAWAEAFLQESTSVADLRSSP